MPPPADVAELLPPDARRRWITLVQRREDMRSLLVPVAQQVRDTRTERTKAEHRRQQLTASRMYDGFELAADDAPVRDIDGKLAHHNAELARLIELETARTVTVRALTELTLSCESYLRDGRPAGTVLIEAPAIELADVMRKNEAPHACVQRLRFRGRELAADRHRVTSQPYPSADTKKKMREDIENLAMRGVPHVGALVETFGGIAWPRDPLSLPLVALGDKGTQIIGDAVGDVPDVLAMFAWLHRPALLKALDGLIDSESDDSCALSQQQREVKCAAIESDALMIERHECVVIWDAQARGEAIEFRADTSPLAVLGLALETKA
jgi:hypothetical protein